MSKYYLCIENVPEENRKPYKDFLKIPIERGMHQKEWDVVEKECPKDILKELKKIATDTIKKEWNSFDFTRTKEILKEANKMPLGFNEIEVAKGAYIMKEL